MVLTVITQSILGRRGLFTYFVWHNRVGVSADDAVFGTVRVTWNGNVVPNLYSSTVELRNESLADYQGVVVRVFSNDTRLLSERADLMGTTRILKWSDEFSHHLAVQPGAQPTAGQMELYGRQREYAVPTMNRGQVVRLTFLNAPHGEAQPSIWLDIVHPGVKTRFRVAHQEFLGTPQPIAALIGAALGIPFLWAVVALTDVAWVAGVLCLLYGVLVVVPGAYCIKLWRWGREVIGG
jgi:hypothetical protein